MFDALNHSKEARCNLGCYLIYRLQLSGTAPKTIGAALRMSDSVVSRKEVSMSFELNPNFEDDLIRSIRERLGETMSADAMFTPAFMDDKTDFSSLEEMIAASPLAGTPLDTIANGRRRGEWDAFVDQTTAFTNWEQMLSAAATAEAHRRLNPS